ncbi:hypothetical protein [Lactobacillus taiwanensis]|uniref:hypothetical protein n=1 Tax=Lactobacillus taiwanensis TaxID=508451 RepID=UPI00211AECFF|nr:hypothetical protein [Lactobacillus taiwanensis]
MKNPRITILQHTGNYLQFTYQADSNVKIWSSAYTFIDQKLGNFMAVIDDHIDYLINMPHVKLNIQENGI